MSYFVNSLKNSCQYWLPHVNAIH